MNGSCDLHAHTTASDGDLTPTQLVQLANDTGLTALGVTDHDTVAGIGEALAAARKAALPLAPGVEISAEAPTPGHMHMLGYFVDQENAALLDALEQLRGGRDARNRQIISRLGKLGIDISYEQWVGAAGGESVGRPILARLMVERGYVTSTQEAFDRLLAKGGPAYVDRLRFGPAESIDLIRRAGGVAVLAHPPQLGLGNGELADLAAELRSAGLAGIEVYYSTHTPEQTAFLLELAGRLGLLVTGGSDFHGSSKPHISLGSGTGSLNVPGELFGRLAEAAGR